MTSAEQCRVRRTVDCLSINVEGKKVKIQKRLILANLKEVYAQFKQNYPDKKIGFSKFAMLRPKECVLVGASGTHQVCVCTIHNNLKLMMINSRMATTKSDEEVPLLHYSHALAKLMCNPLQVVSFCMKCWNIALKRLGLTR